MTIESGPSLVTRGLTVRSGEDLILEDFDWVHTPGRVAWISGPNGVGKSSLMRVLAGVAPAEAGVVRRMLGSTDAPPGRDVVGHYTPAMGLPAEARAAGFVALVSRLVRGAIPLEPARGLGRKRCRDLSTGEEKRLLLGPILARGRPFLFLDEPYEHLSRDARAALTMELARLARTSVVVVATNQPIPAEAAGPVLTLSLEEPPVVA